MFEDSTLFPGTESSESTYEVSDESSYEPEDDFSDEALDPVSEEPIHSAVHAPIRKADLVDEPPVHPAEPVQEVVRSPEPEPSVQTNEPASHSAPSPKLVAATDSGALSALTVDDFAALEERVFRAVSLVRSERQARTVAEERAAALETRIAAEVQAQQPIIEHLQHEVDSLRAEREQVRQRVERLLSQLDALEL
jgi:hypothetical protein